MPTHQHRLFKHWAPLESAWLLMAIEGPFVQAVIARLAEAKFNLAAFGVAFPLAMLFESPIILIMSAAAALVHDRDSFLKLRRFLYGLNILITAALAIFLIPPIFNAITLGLMNLPPEIARLTHGSLLLLLPWPAAIGYRRFYQGIIIRRGLTHRVAYGTTVRLSSMAATGLLLSAFTKLPGVWVGSAALSVGVVLEAAGSRYWARDCVRDLLKHEDPSKEPLTFPSISHFYIPLAMTSVLAMGMHPLVAFFLARGPLPVESLAVMPVINSFVFAFVTAGLTFQEVAIPRVDESEASNKALKTFAIRLALGASGLLAIFVFTPLLGLYFKYATGLTPKLTALAMLPTALLVFHPAINVLLSYQRAFLVVRRKTRIITVSTVIEILSMCILMPLLTQVFGITGAIAAAMAMFLSRASGGVYMLKKI